MSTDTIEIPLYSQTKSDDVGYFRYTGDLHRPRESLDELIARIKDHLARRYAGHAFGIRRSTFAGGRSITVEMTKGPVELTDKDLRDAFLKEVRDQVRRFGREESHALSDYSSVSFYDDIRVAPEFLASHAPRDPATDVASTMSLAQFKKTLKTGDTITLVATDNPNHKALGIPRKVVEIRSKDFIVEPKSYCEFPKAAKFACDGQRFRISDASEYNPTGYRLYEWTRS